MTDRSQFSRRAFLGRSLAATALAGAALTVAAPAASAADETVSTFLLEPGGGGKQCRSGKGRGTCAACGACRGHAANKVFRTKEAADSRRAHKGCRCTIVEGPAVATAVADDLFGKGESVDRRDPKSAELLDASSNGGVSVPVMAATAPVVIAVGGLTAWLVTRRRRAAAATTGLDVDHGDWR